RVYLPNGKAPEIGQIFTNPDLAKALQSLADEGASAFYKGKIAQAILSTSRELGGTMAADDLAAFSPEWVDPVSSTYRGWTVYELPPKSQGIARLEMLDPMETSPPPPYGPTTASEVHEKSEAMKLAYADLRRF